MMRSHACWYVQGYSHANQVKAKVSRVKTYEALDHILTVYEEALASGNYEAIKNLE